MEAFRSRGFYHPCSISGRLGVILDVYSDIVVTYGSEWHHHHRSEWISFEENILSIVILAVQNDSCKS